MDIFVNDVTQSFVAWLLWSLGAFLLGLFLGWWLWFKYRQLYADLEVEKKKEHTRFVELETAHASLKYKYDELEKEKQNLRNALNKCEGDKVMLQGLLNECKESLESGTAGKTVAAAAPAVESEDPKAFGFAGSKSDDLKIIEGIGPKIEQLLKDAGINTWPDLAKASVDNLKKILAEAGDRYRLADPQTWPEQAGLAAAGRWSELKKLQDHLQGGKDPGK